MKRSSSHRNQNGFTLIEIMVALVIFAVLSITLLTRLGGDIRSQQLLEEKTLASVVAENVLSEQVKKATDSYSGDPIVQYLRRIDGQSVL